MSFRFNSTSIYNKKSFQFSYYHIKATLSLSKRACRRDPVEGAVEVKTLM